MPSDRLDVVMRSGCHFSPPRHAPAGSTEGAPFAPQPRQQPPISSVERCLQAGLIAGILGYAVVAVFFAVESLIEGRSTFDIAALLRGTLFFGTHPGPNEMIIVGPVFPYSGPRLVTFLAAGVFIAWLASNAERAPRVWLVALMLLLFVAAPVMGVPILFEERVQAELSPLIVVIATSLSALAMGMYLWKVNPWLRAAMDERAIDSVNAEADDLQ
jgi:hypothetical protein